MVQETLRREKDIGGRDTLCAISIETAIMVNKLIKKEGPWRGWSGIVAYVAYRLSSVIMY